MRPVLERLLEKVSVPKSGGCWLWEGAVCCNGYGRIWHSKRVALVHRVSYELSNGKIPQRLQIDHLCRVKNCVNPSHLEAVTHKENLRRGESIGTLNSRKTQCSKGHSYTESNTHHDNGRRKCKTCNRKRSLAYYHKKKGDNFGTSV
jgi:hypothetical protein